MTCHEYILRQEETYHIICTSADVCRVPPYGTPVPFNIHETLDQTTSVATQSNVNGHRIYTYRSRTIRVRGDEPGRYKGIVSGTVGAPARPIAHSLSVRVECSYVVRVCDLHEMNDGNTPGKVTHSSPPRKDRIIDKGKNKPAKLSHDFAGGMCKQFKLSAEQCAKIQTSDYWKQNLDTLLKNASPEQIASHINHALSEVYDEGKHLVEETVHYWTHGTLADKAHDTVHAAEVIAKGAEHFAEETVHDTWSWLKDTWHNVTQAKTTSEAAGAFAGATLQVANQVFSPEKKAKAAEEIAEAAIHESTHAAEKAARKKAEREAAQKEYESGGSVSGKNKKEKNRCPTNKRTANHNKGKCAEKLIHEHYAGKTGHTMMDPALHSTPNGVSGIDHIAMVGNTAIFIETKANTARLTKAQEYGDVYRDKQEKDMLKGVERNEGRYKQRTEEQQREYEKQLRNKKIKYHKCQVTLQPDPTNCYGAGGRGRCKALNKIKCSKWKTKN